VLLSWSTRTPNIICDAVESTEHLNILHSAVSSGEKYVYAIREQIHLHRPPSLSAVYSIISLVYTIIMMMVVNERERWVVVRMCRCEQFYSAVLSKLRSQHLQHFVVLSAVHQWVEARQQRLQSVVSLA